MRQGDRMGDETEKRIYKTEMALRKQTRQDETEMRRQDAKRQMSQKSVRPLAWLREGVKPAPRHPAQADKMRQR